LLFFVIASVARCPPKLNERRRKQSILAKQKLDRFADLIPCANASRLSQAMTVLIAITA
jgi:hypothetical protein